jgi:hypothetical protein
VTALAFALAVWWTSNTIGHHFIHRPFFRRRAGNRLFAAGLSVFVGYPQALWRERHLAHHAGIAPKIRLTPDLIVEAVLVLALWAVLVDRAPNFFATVYLPGYLGGLLLCAVHGHYEHAGGTISHYGRVYNALLFNDGYHVEHHAHPGVPWSRLPERRDPSARPSAWPAPLRWLDIAPGVPMMLERLERFVLRSPILQWFVLRTHERALADLIARLPEVDRIAIVGGGLFPRTAMIVRKLRPAARVTIIDASAANLEKARPWLPEETEVVHARFEAADISHCAPRLASRLGALISGDTADLLVIPLGFDGDREAIYKQPPARAVIVHDWLWRRRGVSRIVSFALLKRANLVTQATRCQT